MTILETLGPRPTVAGDWRGTRFGPGGDQVVSSLLYSLSLHEVHTRRSTPALPVSDSLLNVKLGHSRRRSMQFVYFELGKAGAATVILSLSLSGSPESVQNRRLSLLTYPAITFPALSKHVPFVQIPRVIFFIGKHFGTGVENLPPTIGSC